MKTFPIYPEVSFQVTPTPVEGGEIPMLYGRSIVQGVPFLYWVEIDEDHGDMAEEVAKMSLLYQFEETSLRQLTDAEKKLRVT